MSKLKNTIERAMFYGATPIIFERAKTMRLNPTKAEKALWNILNNKQMMGLRFKFQHPINQFIADFYCHKIKLVIEVDGEIHETLESKERDEGRSYEMQEFGIETLRLTNELVINSIEDVRRVIEKKCHELLNANSPPSHPPAPCRGRG